MVSFNLQMDTLLSSRILIKLKLRLKATRNAFGLPIATAKSNLNLEYTSKMTLRMTFISSFQK